MAAFCACSETGMPDANGSGSMESGRFLAVEVANPASTRASDNDYEPGSDNESKVHSLRFYFFNKAGEAVSVSANGSTNYVDCPQIESVTRGGGFM